MEARSARSVVSSLDTNMDGDKLYLRLDFYEDIEGKRKGGQLEIQLDRALIQGIITESLKTGAWEKLSKEDWTNILRKLEEIGRKRK